MRIPVRPQLYPIVVRACFDSGAPAESATERFEVHEAGEGVGA